MPFFKINLSIIFSVRIFVLNVKRQSFDPDHPSSILTTTTLLVSPPRRVSYPTILVYSQGWFRSLMIWKQTINCHYSSKFLFFSRLTVLKLPSIPLYCKTSIPLYWKPPFHYIVKPPFHYIVKPSFHYIVNSIPLYCKFHSIIL